MAYLRKHSATSNVFRFKLVHSTTGQGLTGLTSASSGLIISTIADVEATATAYTVAGSTVESITTLGTFAAPTAAKVRFKEVDATNHPGVYEFQIADARFSVSSAKTLIVSVSGAASLLGADYEIELTSVDVNDAVRFGLTALPNVASGSAGAVITSGTGTAQLSVASGLVTLADASLTAAKFGTGAITATVIADGAIDRATFAADTGLQTVRSNTAQAGAASTVTLDASASAVTDFYAGLWLLATGGTGAGQARLVTAYNGTTKVATVAPAWATNPSSDTTFALLPAGHVAGVQGSVTGSVASVTGNVGGNVVGSVASVTAGVTVTTNNDKTGYSLTQTFPSNFSSLGINASGHVSRVVLVDTLTTYTGNTVQTGDAYARIGVNGASLSAVPWNASWDAEVQSEVDDALVAQRLDELLNADSDVDGAQPPTVGSVFHELMTKTAGSFTYDQTTDSLEALRDRGDAAWITGGGGSAPTAAEVADAVWDELRADHTTSGTFGQGAASVQGNVTGSVGSVTGNVGGNVVGTVASVVGNVGGNVGGNVTGTVASVVGNVGGNVTGSVGSVVGAVGSVTGNVGGIAGTTQTLDALQTALNSAHGTGSWATAIGFSTHSAADVWAVGTRTITGGTITTYTGDTPQTGDAYAVVNSGTHGNAALKTIVDAADAVIDSVLALLTASRPEPGQGAPPASTDPLTKIDYLAKAWRNKKTQTATTQSIFADDGTTVDQKATVSDDGTTLTVGEVVSGP